MAGQLKEVRNRIKSVQSTQQITKAMKMVSAAKLRRAQDAIVQMRPYAKKLQEMLSNIVSNSEGGTGMGLATERPVENDTGAGGTITVLYTIRRAFLLLD
jgi:F-type H+-transporting ATPase subunit gamma